MKSDNQINKDVERELAWDARTSRLKLVVGATDGIVSLNGAVENYGDRVAAQNAAHRVQGLMDVVNNLIVKPKRPFTDEEIAHGVRHALMRDSKIPDDRITSTVSDGWVMIQGTVDSLTQRSDAEWAVENLMGVKGVINEIVVAIPKTDRDIVRNAIEAALERRAEREARDLMIDLNDGQVNLSGRVHSWQERKAILGAITAMLGVSKIDDKLTIDPYF